MPGAALLERRIQWSADGANDWRPCRLSALRGATPPSRNGLSNANKVRSCELAQKLFCRMLDHLQNLSPSFTGIKGNHRFARRFRRAIHFVDATTIQLVANCMDWAKHRRRKAAAKCHLRLNLHSFLPRFAIVDTAKENDNKRAREVCADIRDGEIAVFDKAYVDFSHLNDLSVRGVFWVTRAKDNMKFRVEKRIQKGASGKILRDDLIRRIVALGDLPRQQCGQRSRMNHRAQCCHTP